MQYRIVPWLSRKVELLGYSIHAFTIFLSKKFLESFYFLSLCKDLFRVNERMQSLARMLSMQESDQCVLKMSKEKSGKEESLRGRFLG